MDRLFKLVMAAYGFMAFSGCASIVSGSTQPITVISSPEGASVKAEPGGVKTTTPGKLELKRSGGPYKITFSLDNYEPYSAVLTTETNGWVWGNLLLGGAGRRTYRWVYWSMDETQPGYLEGQSCKD